MSLSGFMKQINKANQMLNEKIGGAKGTEIDTSYQVMEQKTDTINRLIEDVRDKTYEYLQPNPNARARLWTVNNLSKMRGQSNKNPYPQPEGTLGESMIKHGKDLGDESSFGNALVDMGESMRQMAGIKYALEDNIKQNFLDPLSQIKDNDLKEVMHLRKKTESRRLDYDCKKRKKSSGSAINDDELQQAEVKFEESKLQTEVAMNRVLQNELEQVNHLTGFAEGFLEYHSQCYEILKEMVQNLNVKKSHLNSQISSNGFGGRSSLNSNNQNNVGFSNGSIKKSGYPPEYGNDPVPQSQTAPDMPVKQPINHNFYPEQNNIKMPIANNNTSQKSGSINSKPFDFNSLIQTPPVQQPQPTNQRSPCCRGLYDFEAENDEELEFKEGQTIKLISKLDENWLEGECNNKRGRFPVSYVEILVPLPS